MVKPAQLLKDLCVLRVAFEDLDIRLLGTVVLRGRESAWVEMSGPRWTGKVGELPVFAARTRDLFETRCPSDSEVTEGC